MDKHELELLAKKYIDGTATIEEKALLSQWYDTVHQNSGEEVNINTEASADEVKHRIFNNIQQKLQLQQPAAARPKYFVLKRLVQAASVAAMLAIGFWAIKPSDKKPEAIPAVQSQLVNVPVNRVLHITLPDGSRVWLKAGSVFRYPQSFTGKTRLVELVEGRAFFDVKHMIGQPFIVKTKNLDVNVLGTSFDVRSYKNEGETRVSVITGKVGITQPNAKNKKAIFLLPKEAIVLSYATGIPVKEAIKGPAVNAWCKNNTVFEQETLENVFKALEKEYNTTITIENKKLLDERISIVLGSQHLDSIIQVLSYTKHFKYQIANDSSVVIK